MPQKYKPQNCHFLKPQNLKTSKIATCTVLDTSYVIRFGKNITYPILCCDKAEYMTVYLVSLFKKISKLKVKAYVYINISDHVLIIGIFVLSVCVGAKILPTLVA